MAGMIMDNGQPAPAIVDLVEQHYVLLYRYAYRLSGSSVEAEDLTQQTFLIAQTKLVQLRNPSHAKAWLFTIIRNAYLKSQRGQRNMNILSLEQIAEPTDSLPVEVVIESGELQHILNEMPEEYRTPLILFYFEEISYREIAAQMQLPIGTVMSRLSRAKTFLRQRIVSCQPVNSQR